jgi:DNA gyrase/topoisomerase IV subunit B
MTTEERFERIEKALAGTVEAQRIQAESLSQFTQLLSRYADASDARMKRIEDNLDGLRYEKVVLATDADVDGLHIRNLLITYFFRFFDQLVHDGHLYVLETPLFRVRNKDKTIYCYSEAERDEASKQLGKNCEITRFKGLGEISPAEFKQFIGDNMRLSKVEYAPKPDTQNILGFYMGKNTPERKDFIMENLVVPVED